MAIGSSGFFAKSYRSGAPCEVQSSGVRLLRSGAFSVLRMHPFPRRRTAPGIVPSSLPADPRNEDRGSCRHVAWPKRQSAARFLQFGVCWNCRPKLSPHTRGSNVYDRPRFDALPFARLLHRIPKRRTSVLLGLLALVDRG